MKNVMLNPLDLLNTEVEKTGQMPERVGVFEIKPANQWISEAKNKPNPRMFFHGLIAEKENTVLFAPSNVGKSILAVQIAEEISASDKTLLVDAEQSDKQFQMRYSDKESGNVHHFPDNFARAELSSELLENFNLEEAILQSIEAANKIGYKFIIVDNVTFICNDSENGAKAGEFMKKLVQLKKELNLTFLVLAHTPKHHQYEAITQYDLAGSAKLINFFDAGIALSRCAENQDMRYLKQVKVRSAEFICDGDHVMNLTLEKEDDGYLHFEISGYSHEYEHLKPRDADWDDEQEKEDILKLKAEGKSIREIAKILKYSKSKVDRLYHEALAENRNRHSVDPSAETSGTDEPNGTFGTVEKL